MVTYSELFAYSLVIIGVIGLFITANKGSNRPQFPNLAITSIK